MKKNLFPQIIICTVLLAAIMSLQSCANYYQVAKSHVAVKPETTIETNAQRYFILHSGNDAWHMTNITLSADKKVLMCTLDTIPQEHQLYITNGRDWNMRYRKNEPEAVVLNEAHLYVPIPQDNATVAVNNYTLQLDKIQKVEILEKDKGRTTKSYVFGAVIATVSAGLIIGVVGAAALASSGWW